MPLPIPEHGPPALPIVNQADVLPVMASDVLADLDRHLHPKILPPLGNRPKDPPAPATLGAQGRVDDAATQRQPGVFKGPIYLVNQP